MIRLATIDDMSSITEIYKTAREFMKANGNPNQWGEDYPTTEIINADIDAKNLYICEDGGEVSAVFTLMNEVEPTYEMIEGKWSLNSEYATIHRVASSMTKRGVFGEIIEYTKKLYNHIRIDTHEQNIKMQNLILKAGFKRAGIIYVEDGSPRIAYEYIN